MKVLSGNAGFFHAPKKKQPVPLNLERDQPWNQGLGLEQLSSYYSLAWLKARDILGPAYEDEAEEVANKVIDELWAQNPPPTIAEIEKAILARAKWRAIDCYRSPEHRLRMKFLPLTQKNDDGEEYETVPESFCSASAEEQFFNEIDRLYREKVLDERFRAAVDRLREPQRTVFILRIEGLKVAEIAKILQIPATLVHTHTSRAKKRLISLLSNQEGA